MISKDDAPSIAVVGMAGAFPGADSVEALWDQICRGVEGIYRFSAAELAAEGTLEAVSAHPDYVPAKGVLNSADCFDAKFFGLSEREAVLLDPQHRVFLEATYAALEDSGHDPWRDHRPVGVFAGSAVNTYYHRVLSHCPEVLGAAGDLGILIANDKDFLTTRASYLFNLTGPSVAVQAACSTSLVAICMACASLSVYQCDIALAGGVAVRVPLRAGYHYVPGGVLSPDGVCRPYDGAASGTVPGDGVGVIVLKRLADAIADRDTIRAVIRGWAVNNDGNRKAGYTAPSLDQQVEVIDMALHLAGIDRRTLGLVEGHGTATPLGDAVELAALGRAIGPGPMGGCALGSVKGNLGHLDAAAGVTGFIKAVLAVERGKIPPSLHFNQFHRDAAPSTRLYVPRELQTWEPAHPRRAGVSSFGIGGTNAHVILEEAQVKPRVRPFTGAKLLRLTARTEAALRAMCERLAEHIRRSPGINLADVAYTLRMGRPILALSREFCCGNIEEAVQQLSSSVLNGTLPATPISTGPDEVDEPGSLGPQKVALPAYPFERRRYWAEPLVSQIGERRIAKRSNLEDWMYAPVWKPCPQPWTAETLPGQYLVFLDSFGFGAAVAKVLRDSCREVVIVKAGDCFRRVAIDQFEVRPTDPDDYQTLIAALPRSYPPLRVIYGWGLTGRPTDPLGLSAIGAATERILFGPLYLARAMGSQLDNPVQILLLVDGLEDVTGSDWIEPGKSMGVGPCRVIPQEYPHIACRLVDLRVDGPGCEQSVARVIAEFGRFTISRALVAIRGGRRWVQDVEPVTLRRGPSPVRDGGVVIVTGGLGGIGRTLAEWLARTHRARLALVGRSAEPNDPIAAELTAYGAEVLVMAADIADPREADRIVRTVVTHWGPVHGLIHAAGVPGGGSLGDGIIATRSVHGIAESLRPKVEGTLALWAAFGEQRPDWTVLCSSLGTLTGGIGGSDYCAANAFLEGFAAASPADRPVIALAWDAWAGVGMAARPVPEPLASILLASNAHAMTPKEGVEVFARILADPLPRVYVSTRDLLDPATISSPIAGIESREELFRLFRARNAGVSRSVEPAGATPLTRTEVILTEIWEDVLGGSIGRHDNFFDLGGHSLLALEILNRVREVFRVELPVSRLFESPTLEMLAKQVDAFQAGGGLRR